jgi:hypothetical protein
VILRSNGSLQGKPPNALKDKRGRGGGGGGGEEEEAEEEEEEESVH